MRVLGEADHRFLAVAAADLPLLARVGIYPEDELEVRLVHGAAAGAVMLSEESRRSRYLYKTMDVLRLRRHVVHLQGLYSGRCQVCLYAPRARYGHPLCEGHHLVWLSRGGEDEAENMALLCPNHHAVVHRADATFNYADLAFTFGNRLVERVQLNDHLPRTA